MRPAPVAAGLKFCRPGKVSRAAKSGSSAKARRDTESAMPLEVSNFTKSRREALTMPTLLELFFAIAPSRACQMRSKLLRQKNVQTRLSRRDDHKHVTRRILQDCGVVNTNMKRALSSV